jgi:hypothetical protein
MAWARLRFDRLDQVRNEHAHNLSEAQRESPRNITLRELAPPLSSIPDSLAVALMQADPKAFPKPAIGPNRTHRMSRIIEFLKATSLLMSDALCDFNFDDKLLPANLPILDPF